MRPDPEPLAYYQTTEFPAMLERQAIRVATKPGVPDADGISPSTVLLAGEARLEPDGRALVIGCGKGALGVALARQGATVWTMDVSATALALAHRTAALNGAAVQFIDGFTVPSECAGGFDTVVMELPKGRALARRWLLEALAALKVGGRLFLAGPNNEGIQPVVKDMEALFGNGSTLLAKQRHRVARAIRLQTAAPLPDWASEPGIAPGTWHELDATVGGHSFHLYTLPGVFSYDRLDDGTRLLLSCLPPVEGRKVLEVGCGYGVVGLVAARQGAAAVDMVDDSLPAIAAARQNLAACGATNAQALAGDALSPLPPGRRYDLALCNPPFHAGKSVSYDVAHVFIEHSAQLLKPGGQLLLGANQFIPYRDVMRRFFERVQTVAQDGRYQVLLGVKAGASDRQSRRDAEQEAGPKKQKVSKRDYRRGPPDRGTAKR